MMVVKSFTKNDLLINFDALKKCKKLMVKNIKTKKKKLGF